MTIPLHVLRDGGAQEPDISTVVSVLFMMVSGGEQGGFLLKSTIISTVLEMFLSVVLLRGCDCSSV